MDQVSANVGVIAVEDLKFWNYSGGEHIFSLSQYVYLINSDSCLCVNLTFMDCFMYHKFYHYTHDIKHVFIPIFSHKNLSHVSVLLWL